MQHTEGFFIEATSHCRDGKLPRWSFWIQGTGSSQHQGMVGTDKRGRGLYLYAYHMNQPAVCRELIAATDLTLPDTISRQEANETVMKLLRRLGWGEPMQAVAPSIPEAGLRLASSR